MSFQQLMLALQDIHIEKKIPTFHHTKIKSRLIIDLKLKAIFITYFRGNHMENIFVF